MYPYETNLSANPNSPSQPKSCKQLPNNKLVQAQEKTLFDDYWRNNPHVPDTEYYSHEN